MISVSDAFRRAMGENSSVLLKAQLRLAGGEERELTGDDFMLGGATFTQAVSSSGSFDLGAAIIGSCSLSLNNIDGRFSELDFTGASIKPFVGKQLDGETIEWVRKPRYHVDQPSSYGNIISLSGLDGMSLFERPYSDVSTGYPATLDTIVRDICRTCGVTLASSEFPHRDYAVARRPDDDGLTCLAMLSYSAQIAGCWCRMDNSDRLVIDWYDLSAWEGESWLDGGAFIPEGTPYPSGDDADGGTFDAYGESTGTVADGGGFGARGYALVSAFSSITLCTDDVVITGVQVTASDDLSEDEGGTGEAGETALSGSEGYVLAIEGNPLILFGEASKVAEWLKVSVVGMRFRPFDASALGDPSIEAGDPVLVIDALSNTYRAFATSYTYVAGGYATVRCDAETPSRNSAASFSAATKAIVDIRNSVKKEKTARQQAIENLQEELENSSGLYCTQERQDDGSIIYYMHDKPKLADSMIVWKLTAEAMGISTDGGETYPYGLDVSGDAILNRIYAIGIDADYIDTGSIRVAKGGKTVFEADFDTGTVRIDAPSVLIGARSAFANDSSRVTISGGSVAFQAGTFSVSSTYFEVTSTGVITARAGTIGGFTIQSTSIFNESVTLNSFGLVLKKDGVDVGEIRCSNAAAGTAYKGLDFNLANGRSYMAWCYDDVVGDTTTTFKVLYVAKAFSTYKSNSFNVHCNSYWNNYVANNFYFDPSNGGANGGVTQTINYVQVLGVNSNGTISRWGPNGRMVFKHGVLTDLTYYT